MAHTSATCLTALRRIATELAPTAPRGATPVRIRDYAHYCREADPSWRIVLYHWGTWNAACTAAGIPITRLGRNTTTSYTPERITTTLTTFFAEHGPSATTAEYRRWTRDHPDAPALCTITKHLGSWTQARAHITAA